MRMSAILTTLVGLAVAGGSAYLARDYVERSKASASVSEEAELVSVLVARSDIALGQAIEAHLLETIAWPRDSVPGGVYTDRGELLAPQGQHPRRAKRAISQGELIMKSKVSEYGEKVTIGQTLGPNLRAMAIKVSAETAVGGFVTPGDSVDVVLTQGNREELRAVTILQNIRVIGVDQDADEHADTPEVARTVTVAVTPEQSQRLALAQRAGTLSLTLRNFEAAETQQLDLIKLSDILIDAPLEDKVSRTVLVRRGNTTEIQELR
ncbi:Flp pilus assembly protein CpaB [Tropicimonas isoalkanivorans]|uniref:Pilus assembly protein CpaB n=1 Tax=Tropicimonas isoalkanivorans TaxID=441112 RepID=A0A1I1GFH5_9RHOB|nr:Flp pilus assembly protein CpaB [Tropicimonas isoalkanivorans]SFC07920.1 pilus assembly protein CpaB [Tropicimonas isoalkanivorans]